MTPEMFDMLLRWLDPDRDTAGKKYEMIRLKLTRYFMRRGCPVAEELADATMERVGHKVPQIIDTYIGDPTLYFYVVARRIYQEWARKKTATPPPPDPFEKVEESEVRFNCLEQCLERLDADDRELIIEYFDYEEDSKIAHRKQLAQRLGITINALRMRAHRIKKTLNECMNDCLRENKEF